MSAKDQIKQIVDYFKREPQLKDKTDGMAEGLLLGANLADDANELSKETDASLKALQREYTENGNGSQTTAEITVARDGELVLDDRLKRDFGNVNAQLAQIENEKASINYVDAILMDIAKGGPGNGPQGPFMSLSALEAYDFPDGKGGTWLVFDSTFDDGAHSFMWDSTNSSWKDLGVYQAAGVADYSVNRRSTSFLNPLFTNLATEFVYNAYYPFNTGELVYDNTMRSTGVIDVTNMDVIKFRNTGLGDSRNEAHVYFWRASGSKESGFYADGEIVKPINATMMRIGFSKNAKEFAVFDGNQEYMFSDDKQKIVDKNQMGNSVLERRSTTYLKSQAKNLFDQRSFIADYFYKVDGGVSNSLPFGSSDLIKCKPGDTFDMHWVGYAIDGRTWVTFWNKTGFVSGVQALSFTVPSDDSIIGFRVAIFKEHANLASIIKADDSKEWSDDSFYIDSKQVKNMPNNKIELSIAGDSISTFAGAMVPGNRSYYPNADVTSVSKTWWGKLAGNKFMLNILVNNSWSGSWVSTG